MKNNAKRTLAAGICLLAAFILLTVFIMNVDVKPSGQSGADVGLSTLNEWFFGLTGVHMTVYTITDWLGLVPIAVCICFAVLGLSQLIRRRSLKKVDADILLLGAYYIVVILGYLVFEMIPINCRPILINGAKEASYPSSTTVLVLSVMPTLVFQINRRSRSADFKAAVCIFAVLFSAFMVIGRLTAGVHWLTDIVGGVLLSAGLYLLYRSAVMLTDRKRNDFQEKNDE